MARFVLIFIVCLTPGIFGRISRPLPKSFWEKVKDQPAPLPPGLHLGSSDEIDFSEGAFNSIIMYYGSIRCQGAWLGQEFVLTAAHCCDGMRPEFSNVRINGDIYDVNTIVMHPYYDDYNISNDVCMLKLTEKVSTTG